MPRERPSPSPQPLTPVPLSQAGMAERKNGGSVTDLAAIVENTPTGIAVDANYVYWSAVVGLVPDSITGSIKRVPINGGMVDTLASGLRDPERIVIDNNYIYFTEFAMG